MGKKLYGKEFAKYLEKNFEPVDVVSRLAELSAVVLLNGGGFDAPEWSVRVSLANLDENFYVQIGKNLREIFDEYHMEWKRKK